MLMLSTTNFVLTHVWEKKNKLQRVCLCLYVRALVKSHYHYYKTCTNKCIYMSVFLLQVTNKNKEDGIANVLIFACVCALNTFMAVCVHACSCVRGYLHASMHVLHSKSHLKHENKIEKQKRVLSLWSHFRFSIFFVC